MKTQSILVQNLCVPCACRCRHCLLSWDGRPVGVDWDRGAAFAKRFKAWLAENRPELRFAYTFGYSMEHPDLPAVLALLRALGSPQAEFLQCDGMRMREEAECAVLADMLASEGVKRLNFTFYGLADSHDRFAHRPGDHALLLRMLRAGAAAGLAVSAGIALTAESAPEVDALITELRNNGCARVSLFVPHAEGRGAALEPIRLSKADLDRLSPDARALLDRRVYRTEAEWVAARDTAPETERMLLLSLRADNFARYEAAPPDALIAELETLDDQYYASFPPFQALAERYGDPNGTRFFRLRDLFARYRLRFAAEEGVSVYDVTDERFSGSRRY